MRELQPRRRGTGSDRRAPGAPRPRCPRGRRRRFAPGRQASRPGPAGPVVPEGAGGRVDAGATGVVVTGKVVVARGAVVPTWATELEGRPPHAVSAEAITAAATSSRTPRHHLVPLSPGPSAKGTCPAIPVTEAQATDLDDSTSGLGPLSRAVAYVPEAFSKETDLVEGDPAALPDGRLRLEAERGRHRGAVKGKKADHAPKFPVN